MKARLHGLFAKTTFLEALDDFRLSLMPGGDASLYNLLCGLSGQALADIPTDLRYALIRRLGPAVPQMKRDARDRRDLIATLLLLTQPYSSAYAAMEKTWLEKFGSASIIANSQWNDPTPLRTEGIMSLTYRILTEQTDAFKLATLSSWATMPKTITTFRFSQRDSASIMTEGGRDIFPFAVYEYEPLKDNMHHEFADLRSRTGQTLAFNVHADAGPINKLGILYLSTHEQVHHLSHLAVRNPEGTSGAFDDLRVALKHEFAMENFILHHFGKPVYRALMAERIAYSFCGQQTRRCQGHEPMREIIDTLQSIGRIKPDWIPFLQDRVFDADKSHAQPATRRLTV